MRSLLLLLVGLLLVGCGGEVSSDAGPDAGAGPRRLPVGVESVVFGTPDAPTGGTLVVGHRIPTPPSLLLVDVLGAEPYARFLAAEAARAAEPEAEAEAEAEAEEGWIEVEEVWEPEVWTEPWRRRTGSRDAVARAVEAQTGVRVLFRDVMPSEEEGLPLVITGDEQDVAGLVAACLDAIRTSPLVRRLAEDPLAVLEARRDGDDVILRLAGVPSEASLRTLEDEVVGEATIQADGVVRVHAPDDRLDPYRHRCVLRWQDGEVELHRAYTIADLVGTTERHVWATKGVEAGATYAPHVVFTNDRTGAPVVGRRETLRLVQGDRVLARLDATSGPGGGLDASLPVPSDATPGPAVLHVGTDEFPVEIRSGLGLSVVTDRALYRSNDTVHVRVMLHDTARGGPVADREVILRRGDVEQRVRTSRHGIASARFRLVDARPGPAWVRAEVDRARAEARFKVSAFETPTFLVETVPASLSLRAGEEAPVRIVARYVNQTPVVGAEVEAWAEGRFRVPVSEATTDAEGHAEIVAGLRPGGGHGRLLITVRDAEGRKEERAVVVTERVDATPADALRATPLTDLVVGLPGRVEVEGPPGTLVHVAAGAAEQDVQLDAEGRATVAIVPSEAQSLLRLRDEEGHVAEEPLEALAVPTGCPLVVADRRVARVGEVLRLRMRGTVGPLVLQVGRDETVLCSRAFPGQDEETVFDLPLDADLAGVLEIGVFRRTEEGLQGTLTRVLVVRDRALDVRAVAVEDAYRPAETAEVDVEIRDREGQPSAAVLGYWGVDEALLALAPWPDGREDVFDLSGLEGESRAGLAAAVERGAESSFLVARKALGAITTHAVTEGEPRSPRGRLWDLAIRHRQAPAREGAARKRTEELSGARCEAAHAAWLSAYARLPLEAIRSASSLRESLAFVLDRGVLDEGVLVDPWGTPLEIGHGVAEVESRVDYATRGWSSWTHWGIPVTSAGPDLVFGTEDDGRFAWRQPGSFEIPGRLGRFLAFFEAELGARRAAAGSDDPALAESLGGAGIGSMPFLGPAHNGLIGLGGGAGGAFRGRGGYRDLGAGGGGRRGPHEVPVHLRQDFDPTLCFVPEAIVGPEGTARLRIPLKDSITTWRLRLVASAADGAAGIGEGTIRVAQPLHVEPWVATRLTVGDVLELPVAVRNETEAGLDTRVAVSTRGGLEVLGDTVHETSAGPRGTGAAVFLLRATAPGEARVRVDVDAGEHRDAVERVIHVRRDAWDETETRHGTLQGDQPWRPALTAATDDLPREHRLQVYTSPMATLIGGLEGLITCPHG